MGLIIGVGGSGGSGGGGGAGVYRFCGSVQTYEDLEAITGQKNGDTYNVIEQFTIDGKTYLAGTNFAWSESDGAWDALGGTIDFTGYYPEMSVGAAKTLIPEASDAVIDNTSFIFQSAGGNASIAESATAKLADFVGNSQLISGVLTGVNVSKFYATGLNQFDKSASSPLCQILDGQKLVENSSNVYDLEADSDYFTAIIKSLPCYTGQGNNNGYVVKVCDANFTDTPLVGFATAADSATFGKVAKTANYNSQSYATLAADGTTLPMGYLAVCVPKTYTDGVDTLQTSEALCVHLAWSGYNDAITIYEAFSLSELTIPQIASGQYNSNGSISDECDFNAQKTIQRLGRADLGSLTWEKEYDGGGNFIGWQTSDLVATIVHNAATIILSDTITDSGSNTVTFTADANGVVHCATTDQTLSFTGYYAIYELATPVETSIAGTGIYNVGDFGTEWFYDTQVAPSACTTKYAANLRDTVRALSNSGVTFSSDGIQNPGMYFGEIRSFTVSANTTLTLDNMTRLMMVTLSASATLTLPVGITSSFSFQIVVKPTGNYLLTLAAQDGSTVYNLSQNSLQGASGKRCYITLLWDGERWAFTSSEWFNN